MQNGKQFLFLIVFIIGLFIDKISKNYIDNDFLLFEKQPLFDNFISLEKVYNTGAAFGILQNNSFILSLVSVVVILAIFYFAFLKNQKIKHLDIVALSLIACGSCGNFLDRISLGHVVDFIQFEFINFPVFNFADIFINLGVIILIISGLNLKNDK